MKYNYMQDAYFMQLYNDFCIFFPISFFLNISASKYLYKYLDAVFLKILGFYLTEGIGRLGK